MSAIVEATDQTFQSEIESSPFVIADFWAAWCGPCKRLAPLLDEIGNELKDSVKIIKINVDNNQQVAEKYGVLSLPTILIIKNAEVVDRITGLVPKQDIVEKIKEYI